jgi:hypothetical protein
MVGMSPFYLTALKKNINKIFSMESSLRQHTHERLRTCVAGAQMATHVPAQETPCGA